MEASGPQFEPPLPPRRKNRLVVIAAPAALFVVVVLLFNAIGSSCVIKSCTTKPTTKKASASSAQADSSQRFYRVASSDSMGSIAEKFKLTIDEIKACNPNIDPNALQIGTKLRVERDYCKKAFENAPI